MHPPLVTVLRGSAHCSLPKNIHIHNNLTTHVRVYVHALARVGITADKTTLKVNVWSTYVGETVFSSLKHVKSKHRTVLTVTHVKELLPVATTEYKTDLKRIVQDKEFQKSHQVNTHNNK